MSDNPETVSSTYHRPCLDCGATVHVIAAVEQPHNCAPLGDMREAIAKAYWAGYEAAR